MTAPAQPDLYKDLHWTREDPPPTEPPAHLEAVGMVGQWRVYRRYWDEHQPDRGGQVCAWCFHRWPCQMIRDTAGLLWSLFTRHKRKPASGLDLPTP